MYAYCWRTGKIEFGRRVPNGAMELGHAPGRKLRKIVEVNARLAYDNKTLLVPGIPEAENDVDALRARKRFSELISLRLAGKTGWPT